MEDNTQRINELYTKLQGLLSQQERFSGEINGLFNRIEDLLKKQNQYSNEIKELREALSSLKPQMDDLKRSDTDVPVSSDSAPPMSKVVDEAEIIKHPSFQQSIQENEPYYSADSEYVPSIKHKSKPRPRKKPTFNIDLEKFIGENLINKIGIAIFIIGVAIGAKYSIDQGLLSPLTRIILGYIAGLGLLGFGIWLKKSYPNYSAVLVSGAMAIMYIITYMGYSFYGLFPQSVAFGLMTAFTVFTVIAALNYNQQVVALVGLVGAYAVPFLLSSGSDDVAILFGYVSIINIGILAIAFKKYWRLLYYTSFIFTWLIFVSWYAMDFRFEDHFKLALLFLIVFFLTFYLIFIAFKLVQHRRFDKLDIVLLITNSFIFYGLGYLMIEAHPKGDNWLGLFTLANALVHFIFSVIIFRSKLADRSLFYMVAGLVLIFITMAIPVQLDGNWVTLIWAGEAALLFWLGRTKAVPFYEKFSYALMILGALSLLGNWQTGYSSGIYNDTSDDQIPLFLNIHFLTSILCVGAFGLINYNHYNKSYDLPSHLKKGLFSVMKIVIPTIFILALFGAFSVEIDNFWNQRYWNSEVRITEENRSYPTLFHNNDYAYYRLISSLLYAMLFLAILSFVNMNKIKNKILAYVNAALIILVLLSFLGQGLLQISHLRDNYLENVQSEYYTHGMMNLGIRYITYLFVALLLYATYRYTRTLLSAKIFRTPYVAILSITILWLASSELLHWMDIYGHSQSYKLGLSILWGVYALFMVSLGIWKNNKYLRIGAMILFAITLVKLFFYDISGLDTISKTIVFVALGTLLLVISFLYNKFKSKITDDVED